MTTPARPIVPSLLIATGLLIAALGSPPAAAIEPDGLGTAASYAVLAGETITNTGPTSISGDIGLHPGAAVAGFGSVTQDGALHLADSAAAQAKSDLVTAYVEVAGEGPATIVATELGGQVLIPGVYGSASGTFEVTGTLTLDAQGDPAATFVFQTASSLVTASASRVDLIGGATTCNVYWQVGSSATLGTETDFRGTILALTSIHLTTSATLEGRALARNGEVTMDTNTITRPTCEAPPDTSTTTGSSTSTSPSTSSSTSTSPVESTSTSTTPAETTSTSGPAETTTTSTTPAETTTTSGPAETTSTSTTPAESTSTSTTPAETTTTSTTPAETTSTSGPAESTSSTTPADTTSSTGPVESTSSTGPEATPHTNPVVTPTQPVDTPTTTRSAPSTSGSPVTPTPRVSETTTGHPGTTSTTSGETTALDTTPGGPGGPTTGLPRTGSPLTALTLLGLGIAAFGFGSLIVARRRALGAHPMTS